jgi:predicted outer membrane repeat protein
MIPDDHWTLKSKELEMFTWRSPLTMKTFLRTVILTTFLVLSAIGMTTIPTRAATLTVTTLANSGAGSLRDTIAAAASGDTINFNVTGTITLTSEIAFSKNLTITGPDVSLLAISGNNTNRIFNVGGNVTFSLSGVSIINGSAFDGGGIYATDTAAATINVTNVSFTNNNSVSRGGAIFSYGSSTITNTTFTSNIAGDTGGAIYNAGGGVVTVSGSVFTSNGATNSVGGAITRNNGALTVSNTTFTGNTSTLFGGAVSANGSITLTSVTFTGNTTSGTSTAAYGGALYIDQLSTGATMQITDTVFTNNSATSPILGSGGAFHFVKPDNNVNAQITRNTFKGNTASHRGGALSVATSLTANTLNIYQSTFAYNTAGGASTVGLGGAIYTGTSTNTYIYNSTIGQNTAGVGAGGAGGGLYNIAAVYLYNVTVNGNNVVNGNGGNLYNSATLQMRNSIVSWGGAPFGPDIFGAFTSQGYNLVQNRADSSGYVGTDLASGTNPQLVALALNSPGTTDTYAIGFTSPAKDAVPITGGCNGAGVTTDQRGVLRPFGTLCDIGAYEINTLPPTATPTATPAPAPGDTIGIYRTSNQTFYLRTANSTGSPDFTVQFGYLCGLSVCNYPVVGDWNGDGVDTIGFYDQVTGVFVLRDANSPGVPNYSFVLGNPNDTPLSGRWTSDMSSDGGGVFRPSNGILYLKKTKVTGFADFFAVMGNPGDIGVAGDWNGDSFDSVGVYRPSISRFYMTNNNMPSGITFSDIDFAYGDGATDKPLAGNWTGTGGGKIGVFRNGTFLLRNTLSSGTPDNTFNFGATGDIPIAGKWGVPSSPNYTSLIVPIYGVPSANESGSGD